MPVLVKENFLPIVNTSEGPAVLVPTVESVRYSTSATLADALTAMNGQIVASAANVAENETKLADMMAFLIERFGFVPKDHETGNTYLTPLFTELEKVPSSVAEDGAA